MHQCELCEYKENRPLKKKMNKKELIIHELKKQGCRITKQRMLIIDIILKHDCSCCKEIYYQVHRKDNSIGIATVYRMVKTLEDIGAIDRKNMYQVSYENLTGIKDGEVILLDEKEEQGVQLEKEEWFQLLVDTLKEKGYIRDSNISVIIKQNKKEEENYGNYHRLCSSY